MVLSRANTRGFELFMYGFFEGEGVAQVHLRRKLTEQYLIYY